MGKISLEGYACERCGHKWISRGNQKENEPRVCPRCHSPYWNVPRRNKNRKKTNAEKNRRKR